MLSLVIFAPIIFLFGEEILVSEWACATTIWNDVISLEVDLDKWLT